MQTAGLGSAWPVRLAAVPLAIGGGTVYVGPAQDTSSSTEAATRRGADSACTPVGGARPLEGRGVVVAPAAIAHWYKQLVKAYMCTAEKKWTRARTMMWPGIDLCAAQVVTQFIRSYYRVVPGTRVARVASATAPRAARRRRRPQ